MVNSSPEFSITKPGLHHLRKRDKPLRTYGRQTSTPEAQSEPPSKKARLSAPREKQQQRQDESTPPDGVTKSNDDTTAAGASEATHEHDASAQNKTDKAGESLKRGSILSYFKPALQVPKAGAPSQQPQDSPREEEPASSPQSSPKPKQPAKRKPRLLKIKATTIHEPSDQSSSSSPSQETDNHAPPKRRGRPPLKSTISNTPVNTPEATSSNKDTTASSSSSSPSPTEKPTTTKPKKKPSSPSIQTTLNISAQAAFSECKICNTVWNPLYPDDVKYHTKTHKAVLRAEKKRKMDEL
ncbi:hypothetical protein ACSS6W_002469 [Trichoderma asperelloides]|nr:hypothetical protein LI328DRAFT_86791 [Trichoderma asperelloides]